MGPMRPLKVEGGVFAPGQSLVRSERSHCVVTDNHGDTSGQARSLWAVSSVVPAAMSTPVPKCGKLRVKWDVSLPSAGPFRRSKAGNGDVIL